MFRTEIKLPDFQIGWYMHAINKLIELIINEIK